jgi:hypothetical protein
MDEGSPHKGLSELNLQLWREAMTHLRHLSDDVFKGVVFFMALNAALLGAMAFLITTTPETAKSRWICATASVLGVALTLAARFMLRRHRIYYLEMLARKSLLEMQLGFYDRKFNGTGVDFALPWRLKPEVVREIGQNFDGWVQRSIRSKGTMARVYFLIYETLFTVYAIALIFILWRIFG